MTIFKIQGHGLSSSFENGLCIKFPDFNTQAIIGKDDIYLDAVLVDNKNSNELDTSASDPSISSQSPSLNDSFCRNITQLQDDIFQETKNLDNILHR